jgi:hypothetical protein
LIGTLLVAALFACCVFWTARFYHSDRAAAPGVAKSFQSFRGLESQSFYSKILQSPASVPVIRIASNTKPAVLAQSLPPTDSPKPAALDDRRLCALGAIETGNNDNEIGRAGEVSRYQIMPLVWKHYSHSSYYENPQVSREVAQRHWAALRAAFKKKTGREPDNFDMYVLWNTCYGYYASKCFQPARLDPSVRDRAQRFVNLVECGNS